MKPESGRTRYIGRVSAQQRLKTGSARARSVLWPTNGVAVPIPMQIWIARATLAKARDGPG